MAYRQRPAGSTIARSGGRVVFSDHVAPPTPAAALDKAKAEMIGRLWSAADAYEKNHFSAGAHAQIVESRAAGDHRALSLRSWIQSLWTDYYQRCDQVTAAKTVDDVHAVDLNFGNHGKPPYSIRLLLEEAVRKGI